MQKLLLIMVLLLIVSCSNNEKALQQIESLNNREIVFPKGYKSLSYHNRLSVDSLLDKDIKVVSYIDNLPCTSCGIRMLFDWCAQVDSLGDDIGYVIIVRTNEEKELFQIMDSVSLPRPLMYYDTDTFGIANGLTDVLARNKTFLLNKDNRIMVVGEFFNNPQLSQLYKKGVKLLKQEYNEN